MDMERKWRAELPRASFMFDSLLFGNGALTALHDKSDGFFRRQIVLIKDRPAGRKRTMRLLVDKLLWKKEGHLPLVPGGLYRLIGNNYQFSIRARPEKIWRRSAAQQQQCDRVSAI